MLYGKSRIVPGVLNDGFPFEVFIPFMFVRVFISVSLAYERLETNLISDLQLLLFLHNTNNLLNCLGQVHNILCDTS